MKKPTYAELESKIADLERRIQALEARPSETHHHYHYPPQPLPSPQPVPYEITWTPYVGDYPSIGGTTITAPPLTVWAGGGPRFQ